MMAARIVEVGPRDGLQSHDAEVPTDRKVALVKRLVAAGIADIEATSFAHPKVVPHLADGAEVMRRLPRIAPSNVYLSKDDKWVVIAANHDTLWRRLAKIMGKPELGSDERFATHHARGEHEDLLDEIIGEFARGHTAEELDRIVNEAGVVCARVYSAADVYADPYFRERELLVEHEDEVHGTVTVPGVVPKLSDTPGSIRRPARWTVGADTDDVVGGLGYDVGDLRERGVV